MNDYPAQIVPIGHVEPVPRRVRAFLGGRKVLDTIRARYVWESLNYPQFYIPADDVELELLEREDATIETRRGTAELFALRVGEIVRPHAVKHYARSPLAEIERTMRFEWSALDEWYEEDELVFVHPRSPYARVDALRSNRPLRVELEGTPLAEAGSSVMVFETGLPTRYYLDRNAVRFEHLEHTDTVSSCPYKGTTSDYWSVRLGETVHADLAWSYDFPTRALSPIAGLVAFYNEKLDIVLDGEPLARPHTHFSSAGD
jgi:uncharacterized protein (DUF427 family)